MPGSTPPQPGSPEGLPSFASLIDNGEAVTVTVTVAGGSRGQVDFQVFPADAEGNAPRILHVEEYGSGGVVRVRAPARWPDPVYVAAAERGPDGRVSTETGRWGGAEAPIALAGRDIAVTVRLGDEPQWLRASRPVEGVGEAGGP